MIKNTKKNKFSCAKLIGFSSFEYTIKLNNSFLFLNQNIVFITSDIARPILDIDFFTHLSISTQVFISLCSLSSLPDSSISSIFLTIVPDLKLRLNSRGLVKSWTKKIFFLESILQSELFSKEISTLLLMVELMMSCESTILNRGHCIHIN